MEWYEDMLLRYQNNFTFKYFIFQNFQETPIILEVCRSIMFFNDFMGNH